MPRRTSKERIKCSFYIWLLGQKPSGMYFADGRSNSPHLGRHSLETRDPDEARTALQQLDLAMAVKHGKADPAALRRHPSGSLLLEQGRDLYREHGERPRITGGVKKSTRVRYRPVFNKFIPFVQKRGISTWNQVTSESVQKYATFLEQMDYAPRTLCFEITTIKQAAKWLVEAGHLPADFRLIVKVKRIMGSDTHCWTEAEVQAIIDHCYARRSLRWLGDILAGLAATGLRISELAGLRWTDIDFKKNMVSLTDEGDSAPRKRQGPRREIKNRRSRVFPISDNLRTVLSGLPQSADGQVFHSTTGKRVWPDSVRKAFIREVLGKLADKFPGAGFQSGRLHSFRHYFCSTCANLRVPEYMVMSWLGHQNSAMVRHYYHLHDEESQRHMRGLNFFNIGTAASGTDVSATSCPSKAS